jgi:PAT family beta-lactamase induction signal transducer AmpG
MPESSPPPRPKGLRAVREAFKSPRTLAVSLLAFSSGMPLGLVWIAIPDWLRNSGTPIQIVGLVTLTQAPWTFKVLWAPLMDRYAPPWLGRRRGWAAIFQVVLLALTLALAGVGNRPETPWVLISLALAIAFASASQDIAIDAYSVDVLRPEEQGVAVGARTSIYRFAMYLAGAFSISFAGWFGWPITCLGLALLYLPMLAVTVWWSPEPADRMPAPRTLREAVWLPFLGFLGRSRSLEILAFVCCYKLTDNLCLALLRPFLIDKGYTDLERGLVLGTFSSLAIIVGTALGGILTTQIGLGHALWAFGILQIFANAPYILLARADHNAPLMYACNIFETMAGGMATGAFSVFLLRITQKRFSATQYALFSSLFGIPRIISGPIAGAVVDAVGWEWFYWGSLAASIPGLLLLQRFSPFGVREPDFAVEAARKHRPLGAREIALRGVAGGVIALIGGAACLAALAGLKAMHAAPGAAPATESFDFASRFAALLVPADIRGWLSFAGLLVFAAFVGLATAAVFAGRRSGEAGLPPAQERRATA